ncbi:MAG: amidohydrolase family protein [Fusobacterium sp.]|uniref:amidohydrolase family protein n=1 Tax=Fusobacterium sp. TaxID=68766 RepID=UPI002A75BFAE|nr:amidohydrolase family protein [Fusobacterium sp.]MDY3060146.1 amidohydrolase family protein [Fusobacterium sp.]
MLLKNIAYLNENLDIIFNRDIRIKDNYIKEIGENLEIEGEEEVINGENLLVTPGLCDAHTHLGQQLLKGKVLDAEGIIWKNIMLPFESSITDEIMSLNTKLALIEMIKAGTTSFVDAGSYHMDSACREIFKSGMRGAVTYSSMVDSSLPESICDTADEVIEKNNSLYENWNGKGLIQVYYSIRSLMSANEELILKVSQEAKKRDAILEAHMNEYDKEVENVIEKTGLPPYEYLEKLGVLNNNFIGAHSLILSEGEKEIIKKHDIKIVQCPFSNSGKALANTPQLIKNGIKIGLGSDGVAHGGLSLWDEMKTLRCMMNVTWGIQENNRSIMPAKTLLKMAMKNGKYFLRKNIGTIKEEYLADLIFIDLNQPHLWYSGNYTNTIFECVNKGDIIHSMVDGKWIMKDRKITTIDEGSVREELKKWLSL